MVSMLLLCKARSRIRGSEVHCRRAESIFSNTTPRPSFPNNIAIGTQKHAIMGWHFLPSFATFILPKKRGDWAGRGWVRSGKNLHVIIINNILMFLPGVRSSYLCMTDSFGVAPSQSLCNRLYHFSREHFPVQLPGCEVEKLSKGGLSLVISLMRIQIIALFVCPGRPKNVWGSVALPLLWKRSIRCLMHP